MFNFLAINNRFSSDSEDEMTIKSLKVLRAISLDDSWKTQEKARIFAVADSADVSGAAFQQESRPYSVPSFSFIRLAFSPIPVGVVAAVAVVITGGFTTAIFMLGGFQTAPMQANLDITSPHYYAQSPSLEDAQGAGTSGVVYGGQRKRSDKIASSSSTGKPNGGGTGAYSQESGAADSRGLSSIQMYGDDILTAFRTFLRERLNRLWVLAQDGDNEAALSIAEEAEKFYSEGDYDAVLRAVSAAEGLLE